MLLTHLGLSRGRSLFSGLFLGRSGGFLGRFVFLGLGSLGFTTVGRSPESEVITQQLHNESAVAVRLFGKGVELSNSVIERLLGKMACSVGGVQNLIVEHRKVQGKTKADGVGGSKLGLGNIGSVLTGGEN